MNWFKQLAGSDVYEDENVPSFHNRPPPPYLASTSIADKRVLAPAPTPKAPASAALLPDSELRFFSELEEEKEPSRGWVFTAAAASALGLLAVAWWQLSLFTSERSPLPSDAQNWTGADSARPNGNQSANTSRPLGAIVDRQAAATEPRRPLGTQTPSSRGSAPEERTGEGARKVQLASRLQTKPLNADGAPRRIGVSRSAEPAFDVAAGAQPAAVRPPPPAPAPAIATASLPPRIGPAPIPNQVPSHRIISPPRWIGGGPTDGDNLGGRYQGTVAVQIVVDRTGRVTRCAPVRGSGDAGLDAMTCHLVRDRARFTPALGTQGRPVVSQAYTTFVWGRRKRH